MAPLVSTITAAGRSPTASPLSSPPPTEGAAASWRLAPEEDETAGAKESFSLVLRTACKFSSSCFRFRPFSAPLAYRFDMRKSTMVGSIGTAIVFALFDGTNRTHPKKIFCEHQ
eukprot:GHVU01196173.1.p1 GENE.GHVU01196173.1~~GHVU01196173.1.p1  ORF type:complete len:114 (-),score=6.58 GHVU01196173.1:745-1086(-)